MREINHINIYIIPTIINKDSPLYDKLPNPKENNKVLYVFNMDEDYNKGNIKIYVIPGLNRLVIDRKFKDILIINIENEITRIISYDTVKINRADEYKDILKLITIISE